MVAEVTHLAVLDIHPRLAHILLRATITGQHLGDSADIGAPIGFIFVGAVGARVPREDLQIDNTETNRFTSLT